MGAWKKVARCKECGKIYARGTPGICGRCGTPLWINFYGTPTLQTSYCEYVTARRKFGRWQVKGATPGEEEEKP